MRKHKEWIAVCLALAVLLSVFWFGGQLLMPPRTEYGSLWDAFLQEPDDSIDVLFCGSSLVYCSVVPACIREESGLRSFVLAGPEQTVPMTYYYIREACRRQSPQLIALDCTGMFFHRYEHYAKANIGYMPLSANRLRAVFRTAERTEWAGLLLPLLNYHQRWREVTRSDLKARLFPEVSLSAGYTLLTEMNTAEYPPVWEAYTPAQGDYAGNLEFLEKIRDFCDAHEIELLLYLTPTASRLPEESLAAIREDAAALGIPFADFNELLPELGIDEETDWYDCLHFNVRGAEKYSRVLAGKLLELTDGASDCTAETDALWERRSAYFAAVSAGEDTK